MIMLKFAFRVILQIFYIIISYPAYFSKNFSRKTIFQNYLLFKIYKYMHLWLF